MKPEIVVITVSELKNLLVDVLTEFDSKKNAKVIERKEMETLYTINEVAKRLRRAHITIKRLVAQGSIRTTSDGRISEKAINDYLKNA